MFLWQIFAIVGLISIILEMVAPSMFFLNLAFAGFLTSIISLFIDNWIYLTVIFVLLSILAIIFLRPLLLRGQKNSIKETGMEGKYVGKIVKVKEPVGKFAGAITIYDERWEARCETDEPIPVGEEVKIVSYDSLVLTVERIEK